MISSSCPQVNLPNDLFARLKKLRSQPASSTDFDDAKFAIYKLMQTDMLPRFLAHLRSTSNSRTPARLSNPELALKTYPSSSCNCVSYGV